MTISTAQVWSAIPYSVRFALIPEDLADCDGMEAVDLDVWTNQRIQVTPWSLLPQPIREALHAMTTCDQADAD